MVTYVGGIKRSPHVTMSFGAWLGNVGRAWHVDKQAAPRSFIPFEFRLLAHLKSCFPLTGSPPSLFSTSSHSLLLVTPFPPSALSPSTIFFCFLLCPTFYSLSTAQLKILFQCFLVALSISLLSFCPWHWSSWLILPPRFRILDISIMRGALARSGGLQTRLDCGRR